MTQQLIYIISAFLLSALCGFVMMPIIMNFCKRKGLYDLPDSRKIHHNAIPRLGGLCFMPSMLLASLVVVATSGSNFMTDKIVISPWTLSFVCSLLIIYGTGLVDDLVGLGAKTKFAAQILAAVLLPLSGLYINNLYGFCGLHEIPFSVGAPLTVFIIVFTCNAINLIDGIDGLSAGLSLFALTGFLVCFLREGMLVYSILIAALMGVLVPFLYYNIWGRVEKGHKVFMGDSGSLTLGYILGFLFVKFTMDNPNVAPFRLHSMMIAYTLLLVPVFDVVRVSLVRLRHGVPIFQADKNHIHHKLMRAGLTQHQSLIVLLALALAFTLCNLCLWCLCSFSVIIVSDIVLWIAFHLLVNRAIVNRGQHVFLPNIKKEAQHD